MKLLAAVCKEVSQSTVPMSLLATLLWGLAIVLVVYLWTASNAFKYCAKFLLYYLIMMITGFLMTVIGGPLKGRDVNNLR